MYVLLFNQKYGKDELIIIFFFSFLWNQDLAKSNIKSSMNLPLSLYRWNLKQGLAQYMQSLSVC